VGRVVETERHIDGGGDRRARFMRRALDLALAGLGLAPPNPMVGAVVVAGGEVVGEGWHEGPGTAHGEINALRMAGERARGGTLYVTLEPCSHQGRTPPCAIAVRDAGIAEVVAAVRDPNPAVDGRGLSFLRDAGIRVTEGILSRDAKQLIQGFARHVRTGLPFVTLKMAASLDGRVAARDGSSRWITGEAARMDAHRLRAAAGAIVIGVGTVLADDPSLTVRLDGYRGRPPLRVVVDTAGRTPPTAAILEGPAPTLIAMSPTGSAPRRVSLEDAGGEVLVIDELSPDGRVSLRALMAILGKREVQDVLVEGGPTLAWAAVEEGVVDRLVLYLAPRLIGGTSAPGILGGGGIDTIARAVPLTITDVQRLGDDLKVVGDVHRDR
jgi:diaminohydroxyphosphoribosylaminopyrimidine deaminase/5-amino-6-(5-phosphoribosylamino)uracil reductase